MRPRKNEVFIMNTQHLEKKAVLAGIITLLAISFPVFGVQSSKTVEVNPGIALVQSNSLVSVASPETPEKVVDRMTVAITAYSSTIWQTDDTPFITASNTTVRPGIIAANFLPFGTRVRIPALYGNKIFEVEDRMHPRKTDQIDIWFPDLQSAKNFGAKIGQIEVLKD